jgi:hypothetical protein
MESLTTPQQNITTDKQATTTFYESAPVVIGDRIPSTSLTSVYHEVHADIKAFLARPVLIQGGSWTTTAVANTNLAFGAVAQYVTPGNPYSIAMWTDKIKGFNLMKGDFILRVQVNAFPFQQGKLLLHYIPCMNDFLKLNPKFTSRVNKRLDQKVQHPHAELSCDKSSVSFRIPYIAPSQYYALNEEYYDWGNWYLDVYSALMTGAAAPPGQLNVDFLVYGYWENVELIAPTVPQSNTVESLYDGTAMKLMHDVELNPGPSNRTKVKEVEENTGPIELALRNVGKTASVLNEVPVLSAFSSTLGWAADIGARMSHIWGWSKPRELDGVKVFGANLARYAGTVDGPSLAVPGGAKCNNSVETLDYASYTNEDEMSFAYLTKVPWYHGELLWGADNGQGASILDMTVAPHLMYHDYTDTVNGKNVLYRQYAPIGYLTQFFRLWRGGVKLTLKFVKTQMHSGKLQVTFIPVTRNAPAVNTVNSSYVLRAVVDIRTEDEISLELPYLAYTDYLNTSETTVLPSVLGRLQIKVLNDLRAPESCSQSIAIQIFFSGGPDLEYAVPTNNTSSAIPYIPQSNTVEVMHGKETSKEIADDTIGLISLGRDETLTSARCIGEKLLSIKQLLLRNSPMWPIATGFTLGASFIMMPHHLSAGQMKTDGAITVPPMGGDLYSMLVPMYAFYRGGVNLMVQDTEATDNYPSKIRFGNFPGYAGAGGTVPVSNITTLPKNLNPTNSGGTANAGSMVLPGTTIPAAPTNWITDTNVAYQHIPYYNALPLSLTAQYNGQDFVQGPSVPLSVFAVSCPTVKSPLIMRAVSDDFRCHFFIGCPPMPRAYS